MLSKPRGSWVITRANTKATAKLAIGERKLQYEHFLRQFSGAWASSAKAPIEKLNEANYLSTLNEAWGLRSEIFGNATHMATRTRGGWVTTRANTKATAEVAIGEQKLQRGVISAVNWQGVSELGKGTDWDAKKTPLPGGNKWPNNRSLAHATLVAAAALAQDGQTTGIG